MKTKIVILRKIIRLASVFLSFCLGMEVFELSLILSSSVGAAVALLLFIYFTFVKTRNVSKDNLEVLIIGAGISGINIAKRLKDIGVKNYTVLEEGSGLGGTWFWNKYPGCACDIPAVLYSFSWHYNPAWTKKFPEADEIQVT